MEILFFYDIYKRRTEMDGKMFFPEYLNEGFIERETRFIENLNRRI